MHRNAVLVLLGLVLAGGGCRTLDHMLSPPPPPEPRPLRGAGPVDWRALVGCWRIDTWNFALDSVPVTPRWVRVEGARRARAGRQDGEDRPEQVWWITGRNSVEFMNYNGLWGDRFELVVRGDSLVGRYYSITHRGGSGPRRVVAVREPCPGDPAAGSVAGRQPPGAHLHDIQGAARLGRSPARQSLAGG